MTQGLGAAAKFLALALFALISTAPAGAQSPPAAPSAPQATAPETQPAPRARPRREPTPGQLAARERFRQCGAEWRELKAANRTGGQRWRDFRRECLIRLRNSRSA